MLLKVVTEAVRKLSWLKKPNWMAQTRMSVS